MKPQFRFLINLLFFFLMVLALGLLGYPTPIESIHHNVVSGGLSWRYGSLIDIVGSIFR